MQEMSSETESALLAYLRQTPRFMEMNTVVIIQARLGSTRLPRKVTMDLAGKSMIEWVIARAGKISGVDQVVVATTMLSEDDELVAFLAGVCPVFRGPSQDVLRRYRIAADAVDATAVIRVTSDCPLLCPEVSGEIVRAFHEATVDYASNTMVRVYPRGLDTEVFSTDVLRQADDEATDPAEREHVTPFIYRRPERFRLLPVASGMDHSNLRWTVDTPEDLQLARRLLVALKADGMEGTYAELLELIREHPEWSALNEKVSQKPV